MNIINKLICKIFGHKTSIYEHDYGEGSDIGSSKRLKSKIYCVRCGIGDMRKGKQCPHCESMSTDKYKRMYHCKNCDCYFK
jgi:hypothetical protein